MFHLATPGKVLLQLIVPVCFQGSAAPSFLGASLASLASLAVQEQPVQTGSAGVSLPQVERR